MALRSKTSAFSFALLWLACFIGLGLLAFASRSYDGWAVALLTVGVAGLLIERVWLALASPHSQAPDMRGMRADQPLGASPSLQQANADRLSYSALAQACHDLRQPTMASSLSISTARALTQEPQTAKHLDAALKASDELNRMIQSMLDLTELDEQAAPPEMKALPLRPLLQMVREQFTLTSGDDHDAHVEQAIVSIRVRCRDDHVIGHAPWITRVLLNLVGNALQHANAQRILITARQIHGRVHISVWDDGVGMTEQQIALLSHSDRPKLNSVISPSASEVGKKLSKNFGLGSSIAQRYARAMGSELRVWSEPGCGTRFDLALAAGSPPEQRVADHYIANATQKIRVHVLVISQDAALSRQLLPTLQAACDCVSVRSVQEFLQHGIGLSFEEQPIGLVILDEHSLKATHSLQAMTYLMRQELAHPLTAIWITNAMGSQGDSDLPPDVVCLERPLVVSHLLQTIAQRVDS